MQIVTFGKILDLKSPAPNAWSISACLLSQHLYLFRLSPKSEGVILGRSASGLYLSWPPQITIISCKSWLLTDRLHYLRNSLRYKDSKLSLLRELTEKKRRETTEWIVCLLCWWRSLLYCVILAPILLDLLVGQEDNLADIRVLKVSVILFISLINADIHACNRKMDWEWYNWYSDNGSWQKKVMGSMHIFRSLRAFAQYVPQVGFSFLCWH